MIYFDMISNLFHSLILFWYVVLLYVKKNNFVITVILFIIFGHYDKPVAPAVPANHLSLDFEDSGQLASCHPEHLHPCSPAC